MQSNRVVHSVRHGSALVSVTDALCVSIGIQRNEAGKPKRIVVQTPTRTDPVLYATRAGHTAAPSLAREVLWGTADLLAGERLRLEAKPGQIAAFEYDSFTLDDKHTCVNSGPAHLAAEAGRRHAWAYNVILESPKMGRELVLDPIIVIVEET